MTLSVGILGPLEVAIDGRLMDLGGMRQRSVVALLAIERDRPMSAASIADRLWPETQPLAAIKTVQVYVSRLRRLLGAHADRVISDPTGYRFVLRDDELDAAAFEDLMRGRTRPGHASRARQTADAVPAMTERLTLETALAMWRGPALGEFATQPFAIREAERLEELRLEAVDRLIDIRLAAGEARQLIGELRASVRERPDHERRWGQLMRALYADQRQAEALAAYATARRYLVDELGVDPSPGLQALQGAILRQESVEPDPAAAHVDPPVDAPVATSATEPELTVGTISDDRRRDDTRVRRAGWLVAAGAVIVGAAVVMTRVGPASGDGTSGSASARATSDLASSTPSGPAALRTPTPPFPLPPIRATLDAGLYETQRFDPALLLTFGDGWRTTGDTTDAIGFEPIDSDGDAMVLVRIQTTVDDACPDNVTIVGSTPRDLIKALQARDDLAVSEPLPVVFADRIGLLVDIIVVRDPCADDDAVRLFLISDRDRVATVGSSTRLVLIDLGGQTLAVDVYSEDLETFWPRVRAVLSAMRLVDDRE